MGKKNRSNGSQENADADDINAETEESSGESEGSQEEIAAEPTAEETTEEGQPYVAMVSETEEIDAEPLSLHKRISAAAAIASTAPQHICGPLNRIEILTGSLKTSLPEAIGAVSDEALRRDLKLLLSIL